MEVKVNVNEDMSLWADLKNGDEKALKRMYDDHAESLYCYAKKFTKDQGLIEDAIHDLFVNIWRRKESIGLTDSIIKYLCVSLRRDIIRRLKSEQRVATPYDDRMDIGFDWSVEDTLAKKEEESIQAKKLENAMAKLSARQREAVYLKFFEELSYEDICEVMELNYQSARNLIARALTELRQILKLWAFILIFLFNG